jgi:hypothetical protein
MKQTLLTPEPEQQLRLTREFWHWSYIGTTRRMLFSGAKNVLTELRFGQYGDEPHTLLTDEEAVQFFQKKLAGFAQGNETEVEDVMRIFHLIPWQEGVTRTVFTWFIKEGKDGRKFFQEHGFDPNCFLQQADLDFAIELSELQLWETVEVIEQHWDR